LLTIKIEGNKLKIEGYDTFDLDYINLHLYEIDSTDVIERNVVSGIEIVLSECIYANMGVINCSLDIPNLKESYYYVGNISGFN